MNLPLLLTQVRGCRECEVQLPLGPRPIVQAGVEAKILVVGQAPGRRVHQSGIPWDDASGNRLRNWMGISREQFYDPNLIAIMPMGLCYPGSAASGDLPPQKECSRRWHPLLLEQLPWVQLTLLIGNYAQAHYLPNAKHGTLTANVANWHSYAPAIIPLPHPSPRNNGWLKYNPWFVDDVLPALRQSIAAIVANG